MQILSILLKEDLMFTYICMFIASCAFVKLLLAIIIMDFTFYVLSKSSACPDCSNTIHVRKLSCPL